MALHQALLLDFPDGIEHFLGSTHRKRGNHHIAAPIKGPLDPEGQIRHRIAPAGPVISVAVGGFQHQIIRFRYLFGIVDDGLILVAHIAGKYDFSGVDILINTAPKDMSKSFPEGKVLKGVRVIELASGDNFHGVEGIEALPSLPGKMYPVSAGRAYAEATLKFLGRTQQ